MGSQTSDPMVAALLRERAGYVARGMDDRVAAVDEQLERHGYAGEQDAAVDPAGAPKGRTAPPRRTAKAASKATGKGES